MDGSKHMVLKFENREDFKLCNELMKVSISDVGISAEGLLS